MSCYAVLDLEMCKIPDDKMPEHFDLEQEIIQIGAVLLDENYEYDEAGYLRSIEEFHILKEI